MANLLEKASIVLTPTGYSEDAIHNIKPSETPFGDITLTNQSTTSTRVNKNGLVVNNASNIPRIDYSKGEGAILVERFSRNVVRYSEDFSNALWTKSAIDITSSTKTNPRGVSQTIYNISRAPAPGDGLFATFAQTPSGQGTGVSIWIKRTAGAGSTGNVWIGSGKQGSATGNYVAVGNEWQRITYTAPQYGGINIYIDPQYGHYFDIWGAQGEYGLVSGGPGRVTSYIPNLGAGTTSRPQDNYRDGGDASLIGAQEGVFFFEGAALNEANTSRGIALSANNTRSNRVALFFRSTNGQILTIIQGSGGYISLVASGITQTNFNKIAVKYKSGDLALWVNGVEVDTNTQSLVFNSTLNELAFDQGDNTLPFEGYIKQLAVFKEILSDAELAALTTP